MIKRILVPLDGSTLSERILPQVRRLLYREDSEVILVHAVVPPLVETSMMVLDTMLAAARERILGIQDRLSQQGVRVRSIVQPGDAESVILEAAEEQQATLMALATHGETGLKRLLLGSVAENLLRRTPIPVLVVRPFLSVDLLPSQVEKPELQPIRSILLPLDEEDHSLAVLPAVTELARLFGSRVILLRVRPSQVRNEVEREERRMRDEGDLQVCSQRLGRKGIETLSLIGQGKAVDEILKTARHYDVDLIAMATHGRTGIARLLEGSVTEEVLRKSTCPLLVARAPEPVPASRKSSSLRS